MEKDIGLGFETSKPPKSLGPSQRSLARDVDIPIFGSISSEGDH